MRAHGQAPAWRTHLGVGSTGDDKSWYRQLSTWWAAHKVARREASLASLSTCWDAEREVMTPFYAEAALDMIAAQRAPSMAVLLYGLA